MTLKKTLKQQQRQQQKNNILIFVLSPSSVKWQKIFVNARETQAFQGFLS